LAGEGLWPGLAPALRSPGLLLRAAGRGLPGGNSLFFCFAKRKVSKRKGDPGCCVPPLRYGQPAVLGPAGVWLNSPSAQTTPALIRLALRSSAHPQGDPEYQAANSRRQKSEYRKLQGHAIACPCLSLSPLPIPIAPSWLGRGAQSQADQGSRCLSAVKRSEFSETPLGSSTAGCPKRSVGTQTAGRLSFAYFSLAKQRKVSCRRATPGQRASAKPLSPSPRQSQEFIC